MQRAVGLVSTTATGLAGRLLRSDVIPVNESLQSTERTIGERTRMLPLYLAWIDELTPGSAPTADPDTFLVISFDDLVGAGEDRWRDRRAKRLRGFEVHQARRWSVARRAESQCIGLRLTDRS